MQYIDFRNEYRIVAVISFAITFSLFLVLSSYIDNQSNSLAIILSKFFMSMGVYIFIFRSLLFLYNKFLWRYLGYRDIDVSGYWHYRSYKSMTQTNTEGYAYISQDMYGIKIFGFNIGSAGDKSAIAPWKTDNVVIGRGVLNYDYELFAERPNRVSRVMKSKVSLNIYGVPPNNLVGTYIDLVIASKEETIRSNLVGSILFSRCEYKNLDEEVKKLFEKMILPKNKIEDIASVPVSA